MKKVFFGNSGAEANECAIKGARKFGTDKNPDKNVIITLKDSFHGRTVTTLSATGTVKAFVWDGISSLKPHAEETVKTIAAAE